MNRWLLFIYLDIVNRGVWWVDYSIVWLDNNGWMEKRENKKKLIVDRDSIVCQERVVMKQIIKEMNENVWNTTVNF